MVDDAARAVTAAELSIRRAWITGVFHGLASAAILLVTGRNIVLAAQYPLVSAAAIITLALFVRQRSRTAAFLLFVAVLTPATLKLFLGTVHVDVAAFVLAAVYGHGFLGTVRYRRRQAQALAAVLVVVVCSVLPANTYAQESVAAVQFAAGAQASPSGSRPTGSRRTTAPCSRSTTAMTSALAAAT